MPDKKPMSQNDASRIQSHVDKNDGDPGFKARVAAAAARNEKAAEPGPRNQVQKKR